MSSKSRRSYRVRAAALLALAAGALGGGLVACGSTSGPGGAVDRVEGQSDFISAPPGGSARSANDSAGSSTGAGTGGSGGGGGASSPPSGGPTKGTSTPDRKVEETDLYRVEGDRLYYLNGYRGLMVFDIADITQPKFLGRSPIFGSPVEMVVRNGVAIVVVADWYGAMDDGSPFHGSIVRGIDANDPANMRLLGEAKLGGWVQDTRVVGDVIYAVSEEYGWTYGWVTDSGDVGTGGASTSTSRGPRSIVSSVSFAGGKIESVGRYDVPGYGGIFNVTPSAIMFAHDVAPPGTTPDQYVPPTDVGLDYIDISDPGGAITARGGVKFAGHLPSWGTDNGRWNLDFADGKIAHLLGCLGQYCGDGGYVLGNADFTNPDAPTLLSRTTVPSMGWMPAARFDGKRMYLAPGDGYSGTVTPIQIFDLSNPAAPKLAGQTQVSGNIWNFTPAGDRLFALGNQSYNPQTGQYGSQISVHYFDVTDATKPVALGQPASFGEGWAWTPAQGTFKAFAKSDAESLVVLPFSGWSSNWRQYNNGLQIIEFTPTSITTSGAAHTKGWVERGVFVKGHLVSLSDLSLSVVDYSNHAEPKVIAEITLARNVVDAKPHGDTVAELSSDWYSQNDQDHSELRVLPIDQAEEKSTAAAIAEIPIDGVDARVYHNGTLSYVVSHVRHEIPCGSRPGTDIPPSDPGTGGAGGAPGTAPPQCFAWNERVQIVDFASGSAVLRGKVDLPDLASYYYGGYGYYGCYGWDWYYGNDVVQVGGDVLAFRRWSPSYWPTDAYYDGFSSLWVVDLSNADAPSIASTAITRDRDGWWGNMKAVGSTLYTTHYKWHDVGSSTSPGYVRYYLDRIDLSDRKHPRIGSSINVPGMLVGGSESDPSILYTVDFRWNSVVSSRGVFEQPTNEFNVVRISGDRAVLQSSTRIPGYSGNTFVRGDKAYMSVQEYTDPTYSRSVVRLYQYDVKNPRAVSVRASDAKKGWGWLLGIEGDRALVTTGWGSGGLDIYRLSDGEPVFDQFVRTQGYNAQSTARQGDDIFLASGQWGVQTVHLK